MISARSKNAICRVGFCRRMTTRFSLAPEGSLRADFQRDPRHGVERGHVGPTRLLQLERPSLRGITHIVSPLRLPVDVLGNDGSGVVEQFAPHEEDS